MLDHDLYQQLTKVVQEIDTWVAQSTIGASKDFFCTKEIWDELKRFFRASRDKWRQKLPLTFREPHQLQVQLSLEAQLAHNAAQEQRIAAQEQRMPRRPGGSPKKRPSMPANARGGAKKGRTMENVAPVARSVTVKGEDSSDLKGVRAYLSQFLTPTQEVWAREWIPAIGGTVVKAPEEATHAVFPDHGQAKLMAQDWEDMWPIAQRVLKNKGKVVSMKWIKAVLEEGLDPRDQKLLASYVPEALQQHMTHTDVEPPRRTGPGPVQRIQHVQRTKAPDPREFSRSLQQTREEADLKQALQNSLDDLAMEKHLATVGDTWFTAAKREGTAGQQQGAAGHTAKRSGAGEVMERSILELFQRLVQVSGGEVAAKDYIQGESQLAAELTYQELYQHSLTVAASLQHLPVVGCNGFSGRRLVASALRRGNDFYALFLACSFCQIPFVAMSTDLPDKEIEQQRNQQILRELKPQVLIVHSEDNFRSLGLGDFSSRYSFASLLAGSVGLDRFMPPPNDPTCTLCLQYTGGTTGASRCCIATQQMALWEVLKYKEVIKETPLTPKDRILQQHSAYWAASLFGEFDIAWSGACALVFATTTSVFALKDCIARTEVTCAGLVPTLLDALEVHDLPSLKVVFTWGEALQARTALKWAAHVHLIDLLIASEYWLCLYADWTTHYQSFHRRGTRPTFQAVPDVQIHLIREDENEAKGEMYLSGPFVSPGYLDPKLNEESFKIDGNNRWYRTRDCLVPVGSGYQYAGRADSNVKDGAKWVDTRHVVEELCGIRGVKEACMHDKSAYICLEDFPDDLVVQLRREIPAGVAVYLVPAPLPRNPATGKVDRKELAKLVGAGFTQQVRIQEVSQQSEHAKLLLRWYTCLLPLAFAPGFHFFCAEDHVLAFFVMILELLLRALLMTYLFLGLLYEEMRFLVPYLRYFPGEKPMALALFAGCAPLWIWIPMLPVPVPFLPSVAFFGAWHAYERQRLLSWPIVVFLNFPRQARECGLWWYNNSMSLSGWKHICGWYQMKWKQWLDLQLERGRNCHHCKQSFQDGRFQGKLDQNDSKWYCNKCWSHYHKHWQCEKCRFWTLRGGEWQNQRLCAKCLQKAKSEDSVMSPLEVPLLEEANQVATPPSPPKRQRIQEELVNGPVPMEVTNLVDLTTPTPVNTVTLTVTPPVNPSLVQTPRGTKVRPLVIPFTLNTSMVATLGLPGALGETGLRPTGTIANHVTKSAEWLEVEEALGGWTFNSLEETLLGIDSIRFTKMQSNLLRKGKFLPSSALQCRNLGELLSQVERVPFRESSKVQQVGQEWPTWGMMWTSLCGWRFHCDRAIPLAVLRQATEDLIWRHVALRTEMADPMELFHMHQVTLSILLLWRAYSPQFASSWFSGLATWALQSAWPKVKARTPKVDAVFHVLPASESFEKADALITQRREEFVPPFQLRVAPYPDGVIVQMQVTHMFSDGFCIVPLQQDFAQLVHNRENSGEPVPLPALESSFDILQPRLFRTIAGDTTVTDTVTPQALDKGGWSNNVRSELLQLEPVDVRRVKMGAMKLGVSHEILLLSAVGISIAKLHHQAAQTLHVLAPQRDDPYAPDVVGLFVDHRRLEVPVAGLHYAGVALALNNVVKKRQWRQPPVVGQGAAPFVNFMWTDFEEPYGFKPIVAKKGKDTSTAAPIQLVIVQPDRECWRILCTFKAETYSEEQVERFYGYLAEALRCLIQAPLTPVA